MRRPEETANADDGHASLWADWRARRRPETRQALASAYQPLVRMIAAKCYGQRVSRELEFADYFQYGMVGLLESIERYSDEFGVKFETFAGHRVRGAILNGVEDLSEVQKQVAVRRRVVRERSASLVDEERRSGGSALERLANIAIGLAIGFALDDSLIYAAAEPAVPDNAYQRVEFRQTVREMASLVARLPAQEQTVIRRHYFQQIPFDEIAGMLALSKGRISQIHRAALNRLRDMHRESAGAPTLTA